MDLPPTVEYFGKRLKRDKEEEKFLNWILKNRNAKSLPQWGCPAEPTQNSIGWDTPVKERWFLKTTKDSKQQTVIFV